FALAAGTYYVVARHGYSEARERVALKAGETIERVLVAPTAGLTLRTKVAGAATIVPELVSYRLQRLDITDQDPVITSAPEARYALAAGRYRIEGRYGLLNARVVREIELKAGQDQQLLLEHQAALLTLKLAEGGVLPGAGDAYWEIRDQRGTLVWATGQSEPRAPLLPGRYNVRVEQREKSGETTVELRSGETRAIDVAPK
ncbi:MAG TPA: hypothetical protein PK264_20310, partial [Hyphomicrobiaceae bacterium]|nr:hypothetical protein [Hyphomicrobiaceae bacterium]